ncbi:protein of unknown function [Streptomyces sp. TLI_053]|uniref:DUF397 domain-containing protein n=1 Tax=Streptomyces sp. TLI_053 TaxID=1855352 RepID=UPI00087C7804|nr:DUF397 domain-containing protein [Streptomyces sp. TLI_053]SDT74939.1 protein of unknown function [Streptomyces sp. TLI_053]
MPEIRWQKSSFSGSNDGGSCVELATGGPGLRHLRESDDPGVVLALDEEKLRALLIAVKAGRFDHLS